MLEIPIGHMEGNYFCDEQTLAELKDQDRIVFRYVTPAGEDTAEANPNGSLENIAGICNAGRNVLGMMPHPERASRAGTRHDRRSESISFAGQCYGGEVAIAEARL